MRLTRNSWSSGNLPGLSSLSRPETFCAEKQNPSISALTPDLLLVLRRSAWPNSYPVLSLRPLSLLERGTRRFEGGMMLGISQWLIAKRQKQFKRLKHKKRSLIVTTPFSIYQQLIANCYGIFYSNLHPQVFTNLSGASQYSLILPLSLNSTSIVHHRRFGFKTPPPDTRTTVNFKPRAKLSVSPQKPTNISLRHSLSHTNIRVTLQDVHTLPLP